MELGVQVVGDYAHVAAIGRICDDAGIAAVALADHYLYGSLPKEYSAPTYDALLQAAALVRDTERVEVVMLVSPITFRHPAVYAKSMTTIDEISGGRFVFGLGTGWHDDEHEWFGIPYPPIGERFDLLDDALGYLRVWLDDPTVGYEGTTYRFTGFDARPRARADLRLLVGGGGPRRTPDLAGRFADEFNLFEHDPDAVAARLAVMREAAVAAGRDPDRVLISTCYPTIGGDDEDAIDDFLAEWGALRGLTAAEARERFTGRVPIGTWDEHAERLAGLASLGFERVYLQAVGASARATASALAALA